MITTENPNYSLTWTEESPTIRVLRATKYGEIKDAIERLHADPSVKPFVVITADTPRRAALIASTISSYRKGRNMANIGYAKRGNTVTIWNTKTEPTFVG